MRKRVYNLVQSNRLFAGFILTLILLNVLAIILESVDPIHRAARTAFRDFEMISVITFSLEYILRLWACCEDPRYAAPVWGRLRYVVTPMAIIDLLSVLPFYLPFLGVDLRFVRSARLLRLLRLVKIGRYSEAVQTLARVIAARKEELVLSFSVLVLLLVVVASLMYYAEHERQPDKFASIPHAMWCTAMTLTSVGYGDVYPVTPIGKVLSGAAAILGIGMFALPTGIISSALVEEAQRRRKESKTCPHCGKELPR